MAEYQASTAEREIDVINADILEREAKKRLEPGPFGYLQGGAGDEWTMRRNHEAFGFRTIMPRVLSDIEQPDTKTSLLGIDLPSPIIMCPIAAQGLYHAKGEAATARGVAEAGSIMCASTYANTRIEDIAEAAQDAPKWFQLYPTKDEGFNLELIKRAVESDYKAIILTADATLGGNREADRINNFKFPLGMPNIDRGGEGKGISQVFAEAMQKMSLKNMEKYAWKSGLPIVLKGVQSPHDATRAIGAGASAIWVSNHGGRQLDGGPASFEALGPVAEAIAGAVPVIFDSGIRRGQHIFKALACGADVVGIGRPVIYGLNLGGAKGVKSVFDFFNNELKMVMQLAGTMSIREVKATRLTRSCIF